MDRCANFGAPYSCRPSGTVPIFGLPRTYVRGLLCRPYEAAGAAADDGVPPLHFSFLLGRRRIFSSHLSSSRTLIFPCQGFLSRLIGLRRGEISSLLGMPSEVEACSSEIIFERRRRGCRRLPGDHVGGRPDFCRFGRWRLRLIALRSFPGTSAEEVGVVGRWCRRSSSWRRARPFQLR